jgi:hypothetical protein
MMLFHAPQLSQWPDHLEWAVAQAVQVNVMLFAMGYR